MLKEKALTYLVAVALLFLFFLIGYNVDRHETVRLLALYSVIFGLYLYILRKGREQLSFWIAASIVFRFILLFSIPNLSEDFYRFIWDGRLLASGYHPFAHPPSYYIENNIAIAGIDESLFSKLNSKDYFTIYPPVAQFLFWICAKVTSSMYGSLIILKSFNFLAEIGSIILIRKLLDHFRLPPEKVLIYALNPLIILELTGNAHFEAVLIFFILLGIYSIIKKRLIFSAVSQALSIGVKLIPVIFLPAVQQLTGWKNAIRFYLVAFIICVFLFIPLLDKEMLTGFQNSLQYYFARFEFNASIYYLVRALGYATVGYNVIHIAGLLLAAAGCFIILKISFKGVPGFFLDSSGIAATKEWIYIQTLSACLLVYYLFTTTLHPWYITTLLALSVFTNFRFAILWSYMIFLTYAGYGPEGFNENLWIVSVEYIGVFGFFGYELWGKKLLLHH